MISNNKAKSLVTLKMILGKVMRGDENDLVANMFGFGKGALQLLVR